MGSHGGNDDAQNAPIKTNPNVDISHTQKQPFDSRFSPPPSPVENYNDTDLQFDDTVLVKDAYETQVLTLAGETQSLDFGDEPQTLNLGDEPQALDLGNEPQASDLGDETQALNLADETQAFNFGDEVQAWNFGDETQALNLGDETHACNFVNETQELDFRGETQLLDYLDGVENIGTQMFDVFDNEVADDSNSEGSDRTKVLDDGDDISDDDSGRRGSGQTLEKAKMCCPFASEEKEEGLREEADSLDGEPCNSGLFVSTTTPVVQGTLEPRTESVPRFTSVRAASLRASGLAARSMDLKEASFKSSSAMTDGVFLDQDDIRDNWLEPEFVDDVDQIHDFEKDCEKGKGLRNRNKCRIGSLTVRKLFAEDSLSQDEGFPNDRENINGGENLLQLPVCDVELAGLSYIDSQEPGDLSQANALKFVDIFIEKNNFVESDHEVDCGKSTEGKSKTVSTAKGPQSLAKRVNNRSTAGEAWIFDWDDNREDEGGGDIFCRRKEEFFSNGSLMLNSLTEPQKLKKVKLDVCRDKEQLNVDDKILVQSDSRLMLHNVKKNKKEVEDGMKFNKNLAVELAEQFNKDSSRRLLEDIISETDVRESLNVGPDTQMAAEAMEALFSGEGIANRDANGLQSNSDGLAEGSLRGKSKNKVCLKQRSSRKSVCFSDVAVATRQSKKIQRTGDRLREDSLVPSVRPSSNKKKESDLSLVTTGRKRAKSTAKEYVTTSGRKNMDKVPSKIIGQRKAECGSKSSHPGGFDGSLETVTGSGDHSVKRWNLPQVVSTSAPIAYRTRHSTLVNKTKTPEHVPDDCREETNHLKNGAVERNRSGSTDVEASEVFHTKIKSSKLGSTQSGELKKAKPSQPDQSHSKLTATSNGIDTLRYPRRMRSHQNLSAQVNGFYKLDAQSNPSIQPEDIRQSISGYKRSRTSARNASLNLTMNKKARSSVRACAIVTSVDRGLEGKLSVKSSSKLVPEHAALDCSSAIMNGKMISTDIVAVKEMQHSERKNVALPLTSAESAEMNDKIDTSPGEKCKASNSACISPANCMTPVNAASPVCAGNEYPKQSCKRNLSRSCLMREISSLIATEPEPISPSKDLRKRRDMTSIRVLFSNHLDEDIIKQQKKILARVGASESKSIMDATHFITDKFVRTRNMLEAIASGKPVVTHLWLESIAQVKVHIDEEAYLLRDTKKEKEFGFSMPVTLARARKLPLLQGQKVLITSNIKPSKETISGLVKAVHGQAVERIGRSVLKDDKVPDDLLILSCEEDYGICEPFLEKGAAVYNSELLLNGIVTQKLEYERHRLFADHVKRTRSTIWVKKNDHKFHPVTKLK